MQMQLFFFPASVFWKVFFKEVRGENLERQDFQILKGISDSNCSYIILITSERSFQRQDF